jgi:hypothetical protein
MNCERAKLCLAPEVWKLMLRVAQMSSLRRVASRGLMANGQFAGHLFIP